MKAALPLLFLALSALPARGNELNWQGRQLQWVKGPSGFELKIHFETSDWEQKRPLAVKVVAKDGTIAWLLGGYSEVKDTREGVLAVGELVSAHGTHFRFTDLYSPESTGFRLGRNVTVSTANEQDVGFSTRFGITWSGPLSLHDGDAFIPGVWYRDNKNIPPKAFGANLDAQVLMLREDRMGSPLLTFRNQKSGVALTLERIEDKPNTIAADGRGRERLTDSRLQTGALGFISEGTLEQAFSFPGTEDERDSVGSPPGPRFLPRSHPVQSKIFHHYALHFGFQKTESFAHCVEMTLKDSIARAKPPLLRADLNRVYRASQDLLDAVIQPYNGMVLVPFQVTVPDGAIKDTSMQMGFVGMALPCAAFLLQDGLERKNLSQIERAEKVIDFWVENAATPSGIPKNWADFPSPAKFTFRSYPTHLRVASDGMHGVLQAWNVARRHGKARPKWLDFARRYGDFLVEHQNEDGSWFGSWNFNDTARDRFTNATTHPIEFLIDLSAATDDNRYRTAALRAGEFCWGSVHQPYSYVGGTPDNPNVTDKEAGVLALRAFMALHDATSDSKWLEAAKQAALFCESWVYWRDLPVPEGSTEQVFPKGRSTVGLSLIATGHSGADNYMAVAPFSWYRLYLVTGDRHFLNVAQLLLHDTKQIMDWDGRLNYKFPGLMPEAMDLSVNRGRGVAGWLPWLTVVTLDPMRRLQETFGSWDIDEIEKLALSKRKAMSAKFALRRGF